jgi:putative transposase
MGCHEKVDVTTPRQRTGLTLTDTACSRRDGSCVHPPRRARPISHLHTIVVVPYADAMTSSSYPTRHSLRLQGYDYAQVGAYFVTVCIQHRLPLLGQLHDDAVHRSAAGTMLAHEWEALPDTHAGIEIDTVIVMPDHLHGILVLDAGSPSLSEVMRRFKSRTTWLYARGVNDEGWPRYQGSLWQSGYVDRVVRDEDELNRIRDYIVTNPRRAYLRRQRG